MMYCTKCGNPMNDDMLFCPKCGTKIDNVINNNLNQKLESLNDYDICFKNIPWKEFSTNPDLGAKYFNQRHEIFEELNKNINDILSMVTDDNHDDIYSKLYSFIFRSCHDLMKIGAEQFRDMSAYMDLFNELGQAARAGRIKVSDGAKILEKIDDNYQSLVVLNFFYVDGLIEHIDSKDIFYNPLYIKEVLSIADEISNCFSAYNERLRKIKGRASSTEKFTDLFFKTLIGIRRKNIETLDLTEWNKFLKFLEEQEAENSKKRLQEELDKGKKLLLSKCEEYENNYFELNPEIKEKKTILEKEKEDILSLCIPIQQSIDEKERIVSADKTKIDNINTEIEDLNLSISKLEKKIFGKQKALEEAESLKIELKRYKEKLESAQNDFDNNSQELNKMKNEMQLKNIEITKLDEKISELLP